MMLNKHHCFVHSAFVVLVQTWFELRNSFINCHANFYKSFEFFAEFFKMRIRRPLAMLCTKCASEIVLCIKLFHGLFLGATETLRKVTRFWPRKTTIYSIFHQFGRTVGHANSELKTHKDQTFFSTAKEKSPKLLFVAGNFPGPNESPRKMKTFLVTALVLVSLSIALLAVVLAAFAVIAAPVALFSVAASVALVALLSGPVTVAIPEEYAAVSDSEILSSSPIAFRFVRSLTIVEIVEIPAIRFPRYSAAFAVFASVVAPSVVFAALLLAGFGVVAL